MRNQFNDRNSNEKVPYISVIITAHDRKEFLIEAIKSVLNQTLDRSLYEMLVVKNFEDEEIDKFIDKENIINIFTEKAELSKKFALGIEKARGKVISFLEDDDLFYPEKLKIVFETFKKYPDLGYYHNLVSTIDENSKQMKYKLPNYYDKKVYLKNIDKTKFNFMYFDCIAGYDSAISIRKEVIDKYLSMLNSMPKAHFVDYFLYIIFFLSDKSILHDNIDLTRFRVHQSASHFFNKNYSEFLKFKRDAVLQQFDFYIKIQKFFDKDMLKYKNFYAFIKYAYNLNKFELYTISCLEIKKFKNIDLIYSYIYFLGFSIFKTRKKPIKLIFIKSLYFSYILFIALLHVINSNLECKIIRKIQLISYDRSLNIFSKSKS